MFTREILNQNRTLTMSNNRKCEYLILHVYERNITLIGIKRSFNIDDIVFIRQYKDSVISGIIKEIADICYEFEIATVLTARYRALSMPEMTKHMLKYYIPKVNCIEVDLQYHQKSLFNIKAKVDNSEIRFLQTPESAINSYKKPFLGYTDIMNYHKETTILIDEMCGIELSQDKDGNYFNKKKDSLRLECLEMYYYYLKEQKQKENIIQEMELDSIRGSLNRNIKRDIFYKYMFKAIDNDNTEIIFLFKEDLQARKFAKMCKEGFINELYSVKIEPSHQTEIRFPNKSRIRFKKYADNQRGIRCDYLIVDKDLVYTEQYKCVLPYIRSKNFIDFIDLND